MNQEKKREIPEFLRPYLWDIDFESLEIEKNAIFIIKRVLDRAIYVTFVG